LIIVIEFKFKNEIASFLLKVILVENLKISGWISKLKT